MSADKASSLSLTLTQLNTASLDSLALPLAAICPSSKWRSLLLECRPFASRESVLQAATKAWQRLSTDEWKAALAGAEPLSDARQTAALSDFSRVELGAIANSPQEDQAALQTACDSYQAKFGHKFFLAAYGVTAKQALEAVQARMDNSADYELMLSVQERSKVIARRISAVLDEGEKNEAAPTPPNALNIHVSTHVLDTTSGLPARDVRVIFEARSESDPNGWVLLSSDETNGDGRIGSFPPIRTQRSFQWYRLRFASGVYFARQGITTFWPEVIVQWQVDQVKDRDRAKLHVPVLLSPFGYSSYRGS